VKLRNSVKAIVIRGGSLLVIRCVDADGSWFLLPGGGQEPGETMHDTLQRECREEIGCGVSIGDLVLVREYIGRNHVFAEKDGDAHQVDFMFLCSLAEDAVPVLGPVPDSGQLDVAWLELDRLDQHRLYPQDLRDVLKRVRGPRDRIYFGDIN
jgi:ADP-ribose pyrophosphatase YjhB (NUDIX family)